MIPLTIPPLRERKEDVQPLIEHFIKTFCTKEGIAPKTMTDEAVSRMMEHNWPGNVRELKNIIERLVIMSPSEIITARDIPPFVREGETSNDNRAVFAHQSYRDARVDFERQFITRKLEENEWNVSKTADAIGLERSNLHRKIKLHGLEAKKD